MDKINTQKFNLGVNKSDTSKGEDVLGSLFSIPVNIDENIGFDAVNEWTLQLLRIRHLGNAEQRLQALFSILVNRLGRRCGQWCELPFRLTHERIGELIGSTRVTSTRLISKLRSSELLIAPIGTQTVSVAPSFIETSPL